MQINQGAGYDHEGIIDYAPTPRPTCGTETVGMFTLDAHNTDRKYYSLAYWAAFSPRYIHINGYYK